MNILGKKKNCGDESLMVLLYGKNLGGTIISGNTDLSKIYHYVKHRIGTIFSTHWSTHW